MPVPMMPPGIACRDAAPMFLEEPVWPPENYDALAELRRTEGVPIAAGENAGTLMEFHRLLAIGAVDFVQPSPAKMGGVTELCKVFPIAAVHNAAVMPHSFYDGPGLLAAVHVVSALGTVDSMIEWRYFDLEGQDVELIKLYGSVELGPLTGLADCVVDLTATGNTLRANRLREVVEVGRSTARLIANQVGLRTHGDAVQEIVSALRATARRQAA